MPALGDRSLWWVLGVALAVRLVALWAAAGAEPVLDEKLYTQRAEALLDGQGFLGSYQSWVHHDEGFVTDLPQYPGAWQAPGQAVFMAAVLGVSGRSVLAVKLAQVLLGALSVGLVYALGRAWFDARAGLAAAWMAALYPNLIAFTHYLWSETLFTFLLLLGLAALTVPRAPLPGFVRAAAAGLGLGLAALTRGSLYYALPPLLLGWALARRTGRRAALARAACALAVATLAIVPWSVRNTALHGGFVWIDTNGPYNLWRGNGPDAFAGRDDPGRASYPPPLSGIPLAPVENRTGRRLVDEARQALGTPTPSDLEIVRHARDSAFAHIRAEPGSFLARVPMRLVDLWNPSSFLVRHLAVGAYGPVPRALADAISLAAIASYLAVVGLATLGAVWGRRRPETWGVLLLAGYWSALSAVSFGLTRFRLPLMPLLIVLAGFAAARLSRPAAARPATAVALALPLALVLGCGDPEPARPAPAHLPNLAIVTLDTTRADHLGLYGYFRDTSPVLDALGERSLVFERAIAPMATTLPTHVSLFTATSPLEHGVLANTTQGGERFVPSPGLRSFAEAARAVGYRTAAFVSAAPLKRGSGIEAGFDLFDQPEEKHRRGDHTTDRALAWLAGAEAPFLIWVHYYDAHWPFEAPEPFAGRYRTDDALEAWLAERRIPDSSYRPLVQLHEDTRQATNDYDAELRFQDAQLGRLLEGLRAAAGGERTALLVVGDHGEGLAQHGHPAHGGTWQEQLRVPLLLSAPGLAPGRVDTLVSVVDALPTFLGRLGLRELDAWLDQASGRDALAEGFAERPVLSQDTGRESREEAHRTSLTGSRYKYFRAAGSGGREELYDLARDPHELRDVAAEHPEELARQRGELAERVAALAARGRELRGGAAETRPADPEVLEQLRALGYLEGEEPAPPGGP